MDNSPVKTTSPPESGRFLVADIGGTNTRIACTEGGRVVAASVRRYHNAGVLSFETLLARYLEDFGPLNISAACIAIAGPMLGDVVEVTNLDWQVDAHVIGRMAGVEKAAFINDLEALGYCLDDLPSTGKSVIFPGSGAVRPSLTRLVVGLGTGFNTAVVRKETHKNPLGRLMVDASESGHISMPVRGESDLRLAQYARHAESYCSIEDVLSGRGLEAIYAWVASEAGASIGTLKNGADITAAIAKGDDPLAEATMRHYTQILGAVLSDMTLAYLPFGGLYLAGGVARHLAPFFERFDLISAYTDKGRKSELMRDFSLTLIEDDYAALNGCAIYLGQAVD